MCETPVLPDDEETDQQHEFGMAEYCRKSVQSMIVKYQTTGSYS